MNYEINIVQNKGNKFILSTTDRRIFSLYMKDRIDCTVKNLERVAASFNDLCNKDPQRIYNEIIRFRDMLSELKSVYTGIMEITGNPLKNDNAVLFGKVLQGKFYTVSLTFSKGVNYDKNQHN